MSNTKDLKYFMRSKEAEIVVVPGPETFVDENGKVIDFEIKVLTQAEINNIFESYRRRTMATDKKGNPLVSNGEVIWKIEKDPSKASRHIIAEALVYPNLKDEKLMEYYNCIDFTDMPLAVFPNSKEYQHVNRIVMQALGLGNEIGDEEDLNAAKN